MEKFHYFLYGKHFRLQTDQKPLASIYKKHLVEVSPRMQRLIVRSLPYSFTCEWVPGRQLPVADALSRNISTDRALQLENQGSSLPIIAVNLVLRQARNFHTDGTLISIREETGKDELLKTVMDYISKGWPDDKSKLRSVEGIHKILDHERRALNGGWNHTERKQNSSSTSTVNGNVGNNP